MENATIGRLVAAARNFFTARNGNISIPVRTSREQLRATQKMLRQRGIKNPVVNPAGTKLVKKARKGTLTLKWGA